MTLPYPPPYQDIDVLCEHLSICASTVEGMDANRQATTPENSGRQAIMEVDRGRALS